ncbi:MAG: protein-disulfide reductase DsbD [Gammaproteobacteria bacterium]|nr:MAG: protein-disulfide reductase DsbD [Gammaproteobacteria bacterium]RKZ97383.1 MAG: protein-disulfide reductase DsbD [Gammaproteobacteria bacterium]
MKKILFLIVLLTTISVHARPGLLDKLGLENDFDTPPSVDEAFDFSAQIKDPQTLLARWNIAEGNYLYRDKIRFEILDNSQVQIQDFSLPAGENKMDETFGLTEVYQHSTEIVLPISRDNTAQKIELKAYYQGCSETFHICYPPTEKTVLLTLPATTDDVTSSKLDSTATSQLTVPQQDRIAQSLTEDSLFKILIGFFGLGLLLAFTPCVFPMIPILSGIIVGEGDHITTHRAFILSLTYVLAMSITYTAAGVLTGLMGENIQAMLQNPWIIGSFSALFVILALSMFGLFELQLPHALQHRLHQIGHQQQGGHIVGAALMGLLSGLIVGPCLAPPLAGALIFIGQQGDPVLGGSALFSLSMGMGLPLLIMGTSAGTLLPKAGDWMNSIKTFFGVLMLALAIWMLERIIPGWVGLLLWGMLFIISAVYLGALNTLRIDSNGWEKLWKGLGVILLIYGGLLMIGGASGSHNIWQPLQGIASEKQSNSEISTGLNFTQVSNLTELNQQLSQTNSPTMLDFYADWCVDCKRMEATTFQDTGVVVALASINTLQLDMTDNTAEHKAMLKEFGIFGPPTLLFFDANGNEHTQYRLIGSVTASELLQHIEQLPSIAR